jgi:hypothetical protein
MAKALRGSTKRALITQANKRILISIGVATFVFMFSAVAANTLIRQMIYQNRVIGERKEALDVAKKSLEASSSLKASYEGFLSGPQNVLGGNPTGTGERDGDNAKIILDALPAKYDFPALVTSIEKLVQQYNLKFESMSGIDDSITQQQNQTSTAPAPIEMPFEFSVNGSYIAARALVVDLERSIRPFQVVGVEVTSQAEGGDITIKINAKTFFQPAKSLEVKKEEVK